MNQKSKRYGGDNLILVVFSILGVSFLLAGIGIVIFLIGPKIRLQQTGVQTTGQITGYTSHESRDDDGGYRMMYTAIVEFDTEDGTHITTSETYSTSSKPRYKDIEIFYDPNNPEKFTRKGIGVEFVFLIFPFLGVVFLVIAIIFWVKAVKGKKSYKRLMAEGQYIWAKVIDINIDKSVSVNSQHPQVITVCVDDGIRRCTYKSKRIWGRVTPSMGAEVKVYVDRQNEDVYHVAVDEVRQELCKG